MQHELWRTEPNGVLSAEADGLRLVVQAPDNTGGAVRFQVLRRGAEGSLGILVGSGTEDCVHAAMSAAEQMANSCKGQWASPQSVEE